ncbi:MAG: methyltransferase domain-containing protein [Candidatus Thermoplasmatota archaeon]|nr:methyltransferase domain-containing protein [Candidatus Thermoplasmatota archaeon]
MKDVFGKALMNYYGGDKTKIIFRRDDNYLDEEDLGVYFSDYDDFQEYERRILEYANGKILDIGCGTGRHSLFLQRKGYHVTGMDFSKLAIKVSKMRGLKNCVLTSAFSLPFKKNSFDTVLLMGNNFGICGKGTEEFLRKMYDITTKNGKILAVSRNPEDTEKPEHLKYHELNRKSNKPVGLATIRIEYKNTIGDWFELLLLGVDELKILCEKTGWEIKKTIKGENGVYSMMLSK